MRDISTWERERKAIREGSSRRHQKNICEEEAAGGGGPCANGAEWLKGRERGDLITADRLSDGTFSKLHSPPAEKL